MSVERVNSSFCGLVFFGFSFLAIEATSVCCEVRGSQEDGADTTPPLVVRCQRLCRWCEDFSPTKYVKKTLRV